MEREIKRLFCAGRVVARRRSSKGEFIRNKRTAKNLFSARDRRYRFDDGNGLCLEAETSQFQGTHCRLASYEKLLLSGIAFDKIVAAHEYVLMQFRIVAGFTKFVGTLVKLLYPQSHLTTDRQPTYRRINENF